MARVRSDEQEAYWATPGKRRSPNHPAVAAMARPKIDWIVEVLDLAPGERPTMVEVGAGSGYFSVPLAERFELTCVDFSQAMLDTNPLPAAQKRLGDAQALELADKSYDVGFCGNLLHHLPDPVRALAELRRVARRAVVIIEPNATNPLMFAFAALKNAERGALKFTAAHVRALAREAGLSLERFTTHGSIVPNATPPALVPMLQRVDVAWPLGFYHVGVFRP
jgi:SAM-dependent methyltransferase